jgi:Cdc6-like AAA superfamily ATPase
MLPEVLGSPGCVKAYVKICSCDQIRALTQRRFSDIIGFLDLYGLINARVISKGRYGSMASPVL